MENRFNDDDHSSESEVDSDDQPILDPRAAFVAGDSLASKVAHDLKVAAEGGESHNEQGKYLKPIVYGALDGITTTFAGMF